MQNASYTHDVAAPHSEKRRHRRIPCSAPIEYSVQNQTFRNLSRDISISGLFIETWRSFNVGETLTLTFPLADNKRNYKIQGVIVRAESQGIGVLFS